MRQLNAKEIKSVTGGSGARTTAPTTTQTTSTGSTTATVASTTTTTKRGCPTGYVEIALHVVYAGTTVTGTASGSIGSNTSAGGSVAKADTSPAYTYDCKRADAGGNAVSGYASTDGSSGDGEGDPNSSSYADAGNGIDPASGIAYADENSGDGEGDTSSSSYADAGNNGSNDVALTDGSGYTPNDSGSSVASSSVASASDDGTNGNGYAGYVGGDDGSSGGGDGGYGAVASNDTQYDDWRGGGYSIVTTYNPDTNVTYTYAVPEGSDAVIYDGGQWGPDSNGQWAFELGHTA